MVFLVFLAVASGLLGYTFVAFSSSENDAFPPDKKTRISVVEWEMRQFKPYYGGLEIRNGEVYIVGVWGPIWNRKKTLIFMGKIGANNYVSMALGITGPNNEVLFPYPNVELDLISKELSKSKQLEVSYLINSGNYDALLDGQPFCDRFKNMCDTARRIDGNEDIYKKFGPDYNLPGNLALVSFTVKILR